VDPRSAPNTHDRIERGRDAGPRQGRLAVEEPLEIRVHDEPLTVTMRTPGDDVELAAGLLFTEGVIRSGRDLGTIRRCATDDPNVISATLATGVTLDRARLRRTFAGHSSCGLCGKTAIDQIRTAAPPLRSALRVPLSTILGLNAAMRQAQAVFEQTGGIHAAAIFDASGRLEVLYEDIGRHNAVDKAIGAMVLRDAVPLDRHVLLVSGRASFEILQKALMASVPVVCAVSAPSSLAVEFARECGMALVGFLRDGECNVYSGRDRIVG
jgi:FdhD protein